MSGWGIRRLRRRSVVVVAGLVVALVAAGCGSPPPSTPWRGADCGPPPTFSDGASLFGCDLGGVDLSGAHLAGADLRGAVLVNANLTGADLSGANLEGANLTGANLTAANLTGAVLAGAILIGAIFASAILKGTSFDFGTVYGPSGNGGGKPSGQSCNGTYCPGYNGATVDTGHPICNPDLVSDPNAAFFVNPATSDLVAFGRRSVVVDGSTSFANAVFDYSDEEAAILKFRGMNWTTADFTGAIFTNAGFACQVGTGARFRNAHFTSTGIAGPATYWYSVDLQNSDFYGSVWTGVVMSDVNLSGSNFESTTIDNLVLENQLDFNNDGSPDRGYNPPLMLLNLANTNFQGAALGQNVNPGSGSAEMTLSGDFNGNGFHSTSFAGANLSTSFIANMELVLGDMSWTTAYWMTVTGTNDFTGANFTGDANRWEHSDWDQSQSSFGGATCHDGTTYDEITNPCLPPA